MISRPLQEFISERRIDGALLETIEELVPENEAVLLSLIDALRPSANTLRELLRLSREICVRDKISLRALLGDGEKALSEIWGGEEVPAKEKQRKLRRFLELRRYPEKSRLEEKAKTLSREIRDRYGVDLGLPEELEGDSLSVQLQIRTPAQLEELSEKLSACAKGPEIEALFRLLLGQSS